MEKTHLIRSKLDSQMRFWSELGGLAVDPNYLLIRSLTGSLKQKLMRFLWKTASIISLTNAVFHENRISFQIFANLDMLIWYA